MPETRRRFVLLGAPVDALSLDDVIGAIDDAISSGARIQHACANAAKLVRLQRDSRLRAALWSCDLVTADGQAVVWAARLLGKALPGRVAGIDLMERLLARSAERGYGVFMLGARAEVIERARAVIEERHAGIRIVGSRNGYFTAEEEPGVVEEIARAGADILFVALDTPQKEVFVARNADRLNIAFAMGVGGSFDVLAGRLRRAPMWMQRSGLEWFFRLAQEPRRLWRRYLVGNSRFIALLATECARSRLLPARTRALEERLLRQDPLARETLLSALTEG